ncbi:MAG: glycosyltransferase family 87 protein [Anaerolineae bacterium]
MSIVTSSNRGKWLFLGMLLLLLFAVESAVTYRYVSSQVPGANDFYSRWAGARALLLEGRDPYGLDVTAEIQPVIAIDPSEVGRGGFAYPLHVLFLFWPLVYLSYAWAQAIWLVALQWLAIGTVAGLLAWKRWQPSPLGAVGLLLAALAFYPVTRTVFLGQFTLWVVFFLVMALWALDRGLDGRAGVLLAATSVKPQMVILIGPWLVLWAVWQRRWRFLAGLLSGGIALLLASLALFPRWPINFLEDVQRYSRVAGGRYPLALLQELVWPGAPASLRFVLAGLLGLGLLVSGWQARHENGARFRQALHWAIVVTLLVPFQTGTTNQVLLLIPLFDWLHQVVGRWGVRPAAIGLPIFLAGLWGLFLATISGNYENPILFLPLPLLTLAILLATSFREWQAAFGQARHAG